MSDVRKLLEECIYERYGEMFGKPMFPPYAEKTVDAILERFDVTPKPVVTKYELGEMVERAWGESDTRGNGAQVKTNLGQHLARELELAGLKIVRVDE